MLRGLLILLLLLGMLLKPLQAQPAPNNQSLESSESLSIEAGLQRVYTLVHQFILSRIACWAVTDREVNIRFGSGIHYDILRIAEPGEHLVIVGMTINEQAQKWWWLQDRTWVSADVVRTVGACGNVPTVFVPLSRSRDG